MVPSLSLMPQGNPSQVLGGGGSHACTQVYARPVEAEGTDPTPILQGSAVSRVFGFVSQRARAFLEPCPEA